MLARLPPALLKVRDSALWRYHKSQTPVWDIRYP